VNALPLYVGASQINALMPSDAPLGWVSVRVITGAVRSNPSPVYVVHDSPGIYTFTGTGLGPAALQNFVSAASLPGNSLQVTAKPGQTMQLYLTGLGPITEPDNLPPPAGSPQTPVEVWVGGISATVTYSGRSPCCAGLDQIDFQVPSNAPQGCWVPLYVRTSHATLSNFTSMAIDSRGAACADASNPLSPAIAGGAALGVLELARVTIHEDVGVNAPIDVTNDVVSYSATQQAAGPWAFSPFLSSPPPGSCTVYQGVGDFLATGSVPQTPATSLNAGAQIAISGTGGPQTVTLSNSVAPLGSYLPLYSLPNELYLTPGSYTLSGSGGADVGPFQVSIAVPSPFTWTNRDETTIVNRSQPLTLSWSGAPAAQPLAIFGVDSDLPTNSSAMFLCFAPAGASSFTVAPEVLSAIPPTRQNPLSSKAAIYLMSSAPVPFSATGLQAGVAAASYMAGKTVIFQ